MIYLDNSATTKPDPSVIETFEYVSKNLFANPSSIHKLGSEVDGFYTQVRKQASQLLSVSDKEIIFTSGGTESNNLAITGTAFAYKNRGKHIITTEIEHASVYNTYQSLEALGFDVTFLPVDQGGRVSLEDLKKALREDTILVSIMYVNNELGTLQPVEEIGELLLDYPKVKFHIDAVQAFSKVSININKLNVDLLTLSGHKIHALKGSGLLYVREGTKLKPLFHGGEQELDLRAGTENVANQAAFVRAMRLALEKEKQLAELADMQAHLISKLESNPYVYINTPKEAAPHIVNLSVPGIKAETLVHALGEAGIYISTQSACSSKLESPSRVLLACGHDLERAKSGIRISFSFETKLSEVNAFIFEITKAIENIKEVLG